MQLAQQRTPASAIYVRPPVNRIKKRDYKYLRLLYVALGLIVILNLNIFTNRLYGQGQFFSPIIFLICLLATFSCKIKRIHGVPVAAHLFGGSIFFFIFAAIVSDFANGMSPPMELASKVVKDAASPIVFFGAIFLAGSMKKLGGKQAEAQILRIIYLISLIGVSTIFISLVFPQWHFFIRDQTSVYARFAGVYSNPNGASMYTLAFMVIGLARTLHSNKMVYFTVSMVLGGAAILLTGSRTGIIGAVFIVLPLGAVAFGLKQFLRSAFAGLVVLGVGIGIYMSLQQQTNSELHGQRTRAAGLLNMWNEGFNEETTGGRTTLAKIAIMMWKQSPIVGHGLGSSRNMEPYIALGPHNYYLTILVESGLFGFIPFFVCWCFVGLKTLDRRNSNWLRILIIGIFLAISFFAMTSHSVFNQRHQIFVIGTAMGLACNVSGSRSNNK